MLRPFPIGIKEEAERTETFTRYREDLISQAGVAVFIMGNKTAGGKLVLADGMRTEFEIAKSRRLNLIPIGASGSMAAELWNEVTSDFDTFYPGASQKVRTALMKLGEPTKKPETILPTVMDLISTLTSGAEYGTSHVFQFSPPEG
jgi:hypothetical protein